MLSFLQLVKQLVVTHPGFSFVHFSFEDSLTECDSLRESRVVREKRCLALENLRPNLSGKSFGKQLVQFFFLPLILAKTPAHFLFLLLLFGGCLLFLDFLFSLAVKSLHSSVIVILLSLIKLDLAPQFIFSLDFKIVPAFKIHGVV